MATEISQINVEGYEALVQVTNSKVGLHAYIAVHSTKLGPGCGGVRIKAYDAPKEAQEDALRLAKAMTYKSAVAQTGLGGGKAVIMWNETFDQHRREAFLAFADGVNALNGQYLCAEDMGVSVKDMAVIHEKSDYVTGLDVEGSSGNPAPLTAIGVYCGIRAAVDTLFEGKFERKRCLIQGVGQVGSRLIPLLLTHQAKVLISDRNEAVAQSLAEQHGLDVVASSEVLQTPCDILIPCAAGPIITEETIDHLQCKVIAGAANNQLQSEFFAELLHQNNILYIPDYVINAGGIINIGIEVTESTYTYEKAEKETLKIYDRVRTLLKLSRQNHTFPHSLARSMAESHL